MFDRVTGQLRPDMVTGIHYAPVGLKTFAKEIKRSLYPRSAPAPRSNSSPAAPLCAGAMKKQQQTRDPRQEIQNFLSMAISRLGSL